MAKKILVVGGGGREHAIIKALKKSPDCGEIWCAPGNGGISYDAKCKNIKSTDVDTMVGFAVEEKFDYVVVAQDDPLLGGLPVTFLGQMVHQQSVRRLPPGAVRLAHSAHEPHAAFRVGRRAWGVQFHPEFSPAAMCGYIAHLDDALRRQGADPQAMREGVKATDWAAALLVRFGRLSTRRTAAA